MYVCFGRGASVGGVSCSGCVFEGVCRYDHVRFEVATYCLGMEFRVSTLTLGTAAQATKTVQSFTARLGL